MKKHHPNYLYLVFFMVLFPPFISRLFERPSFEVSNLLILALVICLIIIVCIVVLRYFKSVCFKEGYIIITNVITQSKIKIKYVEVKGILYHFHYDSPRKYQWKEIELKTIDDESFNFRTGFFMDFPSLETELSKRFVILKSTTQLPLNRQEYDDYSRENYYFDLEKYRMDIRASLVLGLVFGGLGIWMLYPNSDISINEVITEGNFFLMVLGVFFFYRAGRNIYLRRNHKDISQL